MTIGPWISTSARSWRTEYRRTNEIVVMDVYEHAGMQGSIWVIIRARPMVALNPMIGATEAFPKVLIGLAINMTDPDPQCRWRTDARSSNAPKRALETVVFVYNTLKDHR